MAHVCVTGAMVGQISQKHVNKRIRQKQWQKANNNCTIYKHNCFKRLVLSSKSFHLLLGQLLSLIFSR